MSLLANHGLIGLTASFDPDAQAYFTAAGITDASEKTAWNNVVIALKAAGFWTGNIFYPLLGNTASQQKFNAVNPLDTDLANRISFFGAGSYTSSGYTTNGTNAYGDSHFIPATSFNGTSGSFGFVALSTSTDLGYDMGCGLNNSQNLVFLIARYSNGNSYVSMGDAGSVNVVNASKKGMYSARRNGGTTESYKNGSLLASGAEPASPVAGLSLFIGVNNANGTPQLFTTMNYGFIFIIPAGFTAAQQLSFYNIINTNFLTPLGRV